MKLALILPSNIWFAPYVKIYENVLQELNIEYDLISWNRDGQDKPCGFQFEEEAYFIKSKLRKTCVFFRYIQFIKRTLRIEKYDKIIVFSPQISILLSSFLKRYYKKRYIIDYRDLSVEQKPYLMPFFKRALKYCTSVFVSSPGFIKCLPIGFDYKVSHNFDINSVKQALNNECIVPFNAEELKVLTIGAIRDYTSNAEVLRNLSNKKGFTLSFVGKGGASIRLSDLAQELGSSNIFFKGYYKKEDEGEYINDSSMINIFYPHIITHSTALSNRFYNALIYKKPMIVTANSTQGDYVSKYGLGVVLTNCDNLSDEIQAFFKNTNEAEFNKNCNRLLNEFLIDYAIFENTIREFVKY